MRRWVVKAGSQMVCAGGPILIRDWMQQVAMLKKKHGIDVIWVTSGAIATAVDRTGIDRSKNQSLGLKQALSAVGQPLVMDNYNIAAQMTGAMGAQVLLTSDDLKNAVRKRNFQNTIHELLRIGAVPVLNENDAVATEEIQFGDNDSLSAQVAAAVGAEKLVLLTDVDGFFDGDPRANKKAKLIHELVLVTASDLKMAGGSKSGRGTGGMRSKLLAAKFAADYGIETQLVRGDISRVLTQVAEGRKIGTKIHAKRKSKK